MKLFNLHTHSNFSDGKFEPEEYIKEAIRLNFRAIGFAEHAPVPFKCHYTMRSENLEEYCNTINNLKVKYDGIIDVFLSLEIDYLPGLTQSFSHFKKTCKLDYTIGSLHLIANKDREGLWFIDGGNVDHYDKGLKNLYDLDIKKGVVGYYDQISQMIENEKPDIIGHLDKIKMNNRGRYFSEDEKWYRDLLSQIVELIAENNCIVEVNTRGLYKKRSESLFPGKEILKQCYMHGIPLTIASDAHLPEELSGGYKKAIEVIEDVGYKELFCFSKQGWVSQGI